ncbi:MAG TPA: hypothetical protein VM533_07660 [Fimbriiglobus sp.]|nr:hypothetical protein [Fimbriiglobus sp.]
MFSTSLATAAVAGLLASGSLAKEPTWQSDYRKALAQATQQQKPVAVFIARGDAGHARLINEGGIGSDATRVLRNSYVCLYVNTETDRGQALAGAFQIREGLIISDKTGGVQALRHEGTVSRTDLTNYLTRYVNAGQVAQTEFHSGVQPVAQTVTQPAPVAYQQPVYQQPVYQPQPAFSPLQNFRSFIGGG